MPEISNVYYVNAAQAVKQAVSGSDALKNTMLCVVEMDDGTIKVGAATDMDGEDDATRRENAKAAALGD